VRGDRPRAAFVPGARKCRDISNGPGSRSPTHDVIENLMLFQNGRARVPREADIAWVPPTPGGHRGIHRVYLDPGL
jgi:hypothetical protein